MGVFVDSRAVLLDLYRMVRDVYCLHSYLCILVPSAPEVD